MLYLALISSAVCPVATLLGYPDIARAAALAAASSLGLAALTLTSFVVVFASRPSTVP